MKKELQKRVYSNGQTTGFLSQSQKLEQPWGTPSFTLGVRQRVKHSVTDGLTQFNLFLHRNKQKQNKRKL